MERVLTVRSLLLACVAPLLAAAVGCGKPEQAAAPAPRAAGAGFDAPRRAEGPVKLKLITNGIAPFWDGMAKGMEAERAVLGCEATWQGPAQADNNAQKRVFEDAMAAGVDGIGVSPINADAFAPVIDDAVRQGIPVITFDSDAPESKRLAYIGTDNNEAGKRAGEQAVRLFPDGARMVAFVGNMSAQNARDRYQGFLDAVKGKGITMLQPPYEDDKDAVGRAHRNVQDALTRYSGRVDGLLGLYSYNGPAIVDEVRKAGLGGKVKVICFDGEPKTLSNLEHGLVDATVVQKPYEFGRLATRLLYLVNRKGLGAALADMKPELERQGMAVHGSVIDTGVEVVTPANAGDFLKRLHEKGLAST